MIQIGELKSIRVPCIGSLLGRFIAGIMKTLFGEFKSYQLSRFRKSIKKWNSTYERTLQIKYWNSLTFATSTQNIPCKRYRFMAETAIYSVRFMEMTCNPISFITTIVCTCTMYKAWIDLYQMFEVIESFEPIYCTMCNRSSYIYRSCCTLHSIHLKCWFYPESGDIYLQWMEVNYVDIVRNTDEFTFRCLYLHDALLILDRWLVEFRFQFLEISRSVNDFTLYNMFITVIRNNHPQNSLKNMRQTMNGPASYILWKTPQMLILCVLSSCLKNEKFEFIEVRTKYRHTLYFRIIRMTLICLLRILT